MMKKLWSSLKKRWDIKSNTQACIILIVFALTGMTAVQIRKPIFDFIGVTPHTPRLIRTLLWIVTIFPLYYVFLLVYGYLFGQFDFFYGLVKKTFRRFVRKKMKQEK